MKTQSGESGTISQLFDDKALITLSKKTSECDACRAKMFCKPKSDGTREVIAKNSLNAKKGDYVRIEESGNMLLLLSFMQYGLPLLLLLFGIFFSYFLGISLPKVPEEVLMTLFGLSGLILGGGITWFWSRNIAARNSCFFEIVSVLKR